jgi:hypothetical protein
MRLKLIITLIVTFITAFNFRLVFGAVIDSVITEEIAGDSEKQRVTVSGAIPLPENPSELDRQVTLEVLNPGVTKENMTDKNAIMRYMYQKTAGADGSYSFSYNMEADAGSYLVCIGYYDAEMSPDKQKKLVYLTPAEYMEMLEKANAEISKKSAAGLKSVIDDYKEREILKIDFYDKLTEDGIDTLGLFELLINEGVCQTIPELTENIDRAAVLLRINIETDGERLKNILTNNAYKTLLDLDEKIVDNYTNLKTAQFNSANTALIGNDGKTMDEFKSFFYETVVLTSLNGEMRQSVIGVLKAYNSILNIDFTAYDNSNYKDEISRKFVKNLSSYKTLPQISAGFNDCVSNPVDNGNSRGGANSAPPGPAGSSGGGSAGGGYGAPSSVSGYTPETAAEVSFSDIDSVPWAKEAIDKLFELKIISGKDNGIFAPNDNITREEFVKILILGSGLISNTAECNFSDTDKSAWYYRTIASGVELGVITGISENEFGIGMNISRQDMAVLCYRVMKLKNAAFAVGEVEAFSDVPRDSYSYTAIKAMRGLDIINGAGDGLFSPYSAATRAEAAKIIYEALKNL